jgi:NADH-quinone oxidoreductase subunit L
MTRTIWYVFFGEYRRPRHHPPRERPAHHVVPLIILAFARHRRRASTNLPEKVFGILPENLALRFEHFVEPTGRVLPARAHPRGFTHPEFVPWIASLSLFAIVVGHRACLPLVLEGASGLHGLTERNKLARAGYKNILENKYYLDWLYTDGHRRLRQGAHRPGANWVNQNVIDGVVNWSAPPPAAGELGLPQHRPGRRRRGGQRASGAGAEGAGGAAQGADRQGPGLRRIPVLGAAVLAAIFVVIAVEDEGVETVKDLLNGWGLPTSPCSCPWWERW